LAVEYARFVMNASVRFPATPAHFFAAAA